MTRDDNMVGKFLKETKLHIDSTDITTEPTAQQVLYMESLVKELLGYDLNQQPQGIDFVYQEAITALSNTTQPLQKNVESDIEQQKVESPEQEYQDLNSEYEELSQETYIYTDDDINNTDDDSAYK